MSTENINISPKNVQGKCDLKCSYNFKYPESNSVAKNNGVMISLTYDNTGANPVLYNNQKYTVSNIFITCPSIHNFNGKKIDAEFIIEHAPVSGGQNLFVGIPIISSSEASNATNILTEVIQTVANNAPSNGESINLNMSNFTLQNIVPVKPYFSYTSANDSSDWIVYGQQEAIPLNSSTLETLGKIIKPFPLPTPGKGLFYNSHGPSNNLGLGKGIYISCKPTGSSKEEVPVAYDKNTTSYDLSSLLSNPNTKTIFQIIIGCVVFILLFLSLNYLYTYLTSDKPKLNFSLPSISNK